MMKSIKKGLLIALALWFAGMAVYFFASGESERMDDNYMYTVLETAMENPNLGGMLRSKNGRRNKQFPKGLNFILETFSEKEEMFVDGVRREIVVAQISRNSNEFFLLDVSEIEDYDYKANSLLKIKSKYDCNIRFTEDGIDSDYIVIKAFNVEEYKVEPLDVEASHIYDVNTSGKDGTITFNDFVLEGSELHVFFKFKNDIPGNDYPFYTGLRFYQNGEELSVVDNSREYVDVYDPLFETVKTLQEKDYFLTLKAVDEDYIIDKDLPIEIVQFNDYFQKNQTSSHNIK